MAYKSCMSIYLALKNIKRKKTRHSMCGFNELRKEKNSIFFLPSLLSRDLGFFLVENVGHKQES